MKINEFKSVLDKKKCDFAVFYNSDSTRHNANMLYFSGYDGLGALVVPSSKPSFLVVPQMEFYRAKKSMIRKIYSMEKKRFFESTYKMAKKNKLKSKNIALDKSTVTLNAYTHFKKQFKNARAKDVSFECLKLREIKTQKEIQYIKRSCIYADKIIQKLIRNFKDFRTESDAAAFLGHEARKIGLDMAFNPIVASGSNSSIPHHNPASTKTKNGFCVIDFGVKYKGYCSDITRTICVGSPTKREKEAYNLLLSIQKDAISEVKNNKKCSELYDFAVKSLGGYKKFFTHGLGHGLGIEIHEMPNLTLNSKDRIKNNMVFTIEPGIYLPGKFGIRIEDTILFKSRPIILTKTSKDLLIA